MKRPLVYIASPYTKGDVAENVRVSCQMFDILLSSGLLNPIAPLWSHFQQIFYPRQYEEWMAYDFAIIERCDAVLRLPGESSGADREVAVCVGLGKPVFYTLRDLLKWAKDVA